MNDLGSYLVMLLVVFVAGILCAVFLFSCTPKNEAGWITLNSTMSAQDLFNDELEVKAQKQHVFCHAQHGMGTPGYAECFNNYYGLVLAWRNIAKPAFTAELHRVEAKLTVAEHLRLKPEYNWRKDLKPVVCALRQLTEKAGDLLGTSKERILEVLKPATQRVGCR